MSQSNEIVQEMDILRHMLGVATNTKPRDYGYRNYFNAEPGHGDYPVLERLLSRGLIRAGRPGYFHATVDGCRAIGLNEKQIKKAIPSSGAAA